ncbi:beta-defensin 127-like [Lemur catta]|uniref:beta-defensin 127-like n=1 Tax=Lemur catta TaxID=9447 RepID=UPI001E268147|nr:beta-defensin 127-like [Lemur catta]
MGLFLIIAILLFQKPTVTELKKCWDNHIQGNCRRICKITERREVLCANERYCCLSIKDIEARKRITQPPRPKRPTFALTRPQDEDIIDTSPTHKIYSA